VGWRSQPVYRAEELDLPLPSVDYHLKVLQLCRVTKPIEQRSASDSAAARHQSQVDPAVTVNDQHNRDPTASFKSVCLVDGDRRADVNPEAKVYSLPGDQAPEAHVFQKVLEVLDQEAARLAVSMQLPTDAQDRVKKVVRDLSLTNRDIHLIYSQIGEALDFTAEETVQTAFLSIWAQSFPEEVEELLSGFRDELPYRETDDGIVVTPAAEPALPS
jgi:hypothetical protein